MISRNTVIAFSTELDNLLLDGSHKRVCTAYNISIDYLEGRLLATWLIVNYCSCNTLSIIPLCMTVYV